LRVSSSTHLRERTANLRTASFAALGCAAVLILGCSRKSGAKIGARQTSVKNEVKNASSVTEGVGLLESLRADAKFDPSARHFFLTSTVSSASLLVLQGWQQVTLPVAIEPRQFVSLQPPRDTA